MYYLEAIFGKTLGRIVFHLFQAIIGVIAVVVDVVISLVFSHYQKSPAELELSLGSSSELEHEDISTFFYKAGGNRKPGTLTLRSQAKTGGRQFAQSSKQMHIYDLLGSEVKPKRVARVASQVEAQGILSATDADRQLVTQIIAAATEVYQNLGAGLKQEVYQEGLYIELAELDMICNVSKTNGLRYKGVRIGRERGDLLVEDRCKVNLRSATSLVGRDFVNAKNEIVSEGLDLGLVINFGAQGIECRRVYHPKRRLIYNSQNQNKLAMLSASKSKSTRKAKAKTRSSSRRRAA